MKTTIKQEARGAGVDVMYKVDPKKLSIKLCYTALAVENATKVATNFENFSFEAVRMKPEVPEKIGQLPAFVDGAFYCRTEEEAQDFFENKLGCNFHKLKIHKRLFVSIVLRAFLKCQFHDPLIVG